MKKDWDKEFIDMLGLFESKSKCVAKKVVCIITKNNNVLSIGINGTLSGSENCCDVFNEKDKYGQYHKKKIKRKNSVNQQDITEKISDTDKESHHYWSLVNEIHAEMNAIYKATQEMNCNISGSTVYISYCPCINCSKMLALYGVKRVVYKNDYDNSDDVIKFLKSHNINVTKYYNEEENEEDTFAIPREDIIGGIKIYPAGSFLYDRSSQLKAFEKYKEENDRLYCYSDDDIKIGVITNLTDEYATIKLIDSDLKNKLKEELSKDDCTLILQTKIKVKEYLDLPFILAKDYLIHKPDHKFSEEESITVVITESIERFKLKKK